MNTSSAGWYAKGQSFETILAIDREKSPAYGLTVQSVMAQLGAYLREDFARQELIMNDEPLIYRLKFADFDKFELQDLFWMTMRGERNQPVHLADIAHIAERPTQFLIARENQQYQHWITFEFHGPWKPGNRYVESIVKNTHLPPGYKLEQPEWRWGSVEEEKELWKVIGLSLLLIFMVTAALFESLKQPFIIMMAVPMAPVGVFLIFWLTEQPFDRSAYIDVALLGGIVVKNAIIMVDHINQLRHSGVERRAAIITGAADRLIDGLAPAIRVVVVDEIQFVPRLLDVIHRKREERKRRGTPLQFIMSGSSARKLKRGAANLLAGRALVYHLFPLTTTELQNVFDWQTALEYGTLPEVWHL